MLSMNLRIRLCIGYNLIFFACSLFSGCNGNETEIVILWKDDQAIGVSLPKALIQNVSDSLEEHVAVRLISKGNAVPVLGNYTAETERIVFEPLIPFTR